MMNIYERIHNLAIKYNVSFRAIYLYVFNCYVTDFRTPIERINYLENHI